MKFDENICMQERARQMVSLSTKKECTNNCNDAFTYEASYALDDTVIVISSEQNSQLNYI